MRWKSRVVSAGSSLAARIASRWRAIAGEMSRTKSKVWDSVAHDSICHGPEQILGHSGFVNLECVGRVQKTVRKDPLASRHCGSDHGAHVVVAGCAYQKQLFRW